MDGSIVMNTQVEKAVTGLAIIIENANEAAQLRQRYNGLYDVVVFDDLDQLMLTPSLQQFDLIICSQTILEQSQVTHSVASISRKFTESKLLIVGAAKPMSVQISALKQGARGYFNQDLPIEKLDVALDVILNGEVWVERQVMSELLDELSQLPEVSREQRQAIQTLSPKEFAVAKLVSHGATNKMIAKQMHITERTVKAHLTTIFQKLDLPDRLSLAILFRDLRL